MLTFNEMLVSTYGVACLTVTLNALLQMELYIVVHCKVQGIKRNIRGGGVVWEGGRNRTEQD
jgi:hypothetical protein